MQKQEDEMHIKSGQKVRKKHPFQQPKHKYNDILKRS